MNNIKLLDCTLRDGGYVNEWDFGKDTISKISRKLITAGIDIVECGYLSTKNSGDEGVARYSSIEDVKRAYAKTKSAHQEYAVMINFGEYPIELLEKANSDSPIIRLAFHKKNMQEAIEYLKGLKSLGYKFFIQPMGTLNYSDEEFKSLILQVNDIEPECFYIVDSFGVMELKDFSRLMLIADKTLSKSICLGYHSHNNLQQAYSNSKYMAEQSLEHSLIIDASVFGMGRGAGNLNIELFAAYLNQNFDKAYQIEPILEIFDECLKPIFAKTFWGYSLPYYLSSLYNCHPNYASFFADKNTLSVKSMHQLLAMISDEDKISFSVDKANEYYNKFQTNHIDDHKTLDELVLKLQGRDILILAPGKSIVDKYDSICSYIEKNKPVILGVNLPNEKYSYDYLFLSNEKRYPEKPFENVEKYIITSNIKRDSIDALKVNYASFLCENEKVVDNPTLMLLNMLISLGIKEISIAGMDGFDSNADNNYFSKELSLGSDTKSKMKRNEYIKGEIAKIREKISLNFLTESMYIED